MKTKKRRRTIDPSKAAAAVLGGFYNRIEITQAGWPSCVACGHKTALVDSEHGECLKCLLERRRQAREGESLTVEG